MNGVVEYCEYVWGNLFDSIFKLTTDVSKSLTFIEYIEIYPNSLTI